LSERQEDAIRAAGWQISAVIPDIDQDAIPQCARFLAVAEERSFTKAAAKPGTFQSSLSHTVRRLDPTLITLRHVGGKRQAAGFQRARPP
jgi:hypothetical protein